MIGMRDMHGKIIKSAHIPTLIIIYSRTQLYRTLKGNRNWFHLAGVRYIQTFIKANLWWPEYDISDQRLDLKISYFLDFQFPAFFLIKYREFPT